MVNTMFPDSACKATVNTITTQFVRLWSTQCFLTQLVRRQSTPLPPISPLPPITVTLYANPVSTVTTKFVSLWPTRCYVTHLVMLQSTPLSLTLYCNSTHHYHSLCKAILNTTRTSRLVRDAGLGDQGCQSINGLLVCCNNIDMVKKMYQKANNTY